MTIKYCINKPFPTYEEIKKQLLESLPQTPIDPPGFEFAGIKFPGKPSNPFPSRESLQAEIENLTQSIKRYQNLSLMLEIIDVLSEYIPDIPDIPGLPGVNIFTLLSGDPDELLETIRNLIPILPEVKETEVSMDSVEPIAAEDEAEVKKTKSEQLKDFLNKGAAQAETSITETSEEVVQQIESRVLSLFPFLPIPTPIYDTLRDPDFEVISFMQYSIDLYLTSLIDLAVGWVNEVLEILPVTGDALELEFLPFPTPTELKEQFMAFVEAQKAKIEEQVAEMESDVQSIAQDIKDIDIKLPSFSVPSSKEDVVDPEFDVDQFIKRELAKLQTLSIEEIVGFIVDTLEIPLPLELVCINFDVKAAVSEVSGILESSMDSAITDIIS